MPSELPPIPGGEADGKILAVLAHLSGFIGMPFVLPLIIYLVKRNDSPFVAENAREAVNFHITLFLACLVCAILIFVFIGFFLLAALGLVSFVLSIVAAVRAAEGNVYRYPCTLRLI